MKNEAWIDYSKCVVIPFMQKRKLTFARVIIGQAREYVASLFADGQTAVIEINYTRPLYGSDGEADIFKCHNVGDATLAAGIVEEYLTKYVIEAES